MNIQDLKSNTTWQEASNTINNNNNKISLAIATLENAKLKNKGYFTTVEKLNEAIPNPTIGSKAYVGTSEPYAIYIVENGVWVDSGYTGGDEIVAKISTDRIENGAVTSEKIATSVFDSTLSVSGKIAPADIVGRKLNELESKTDQQFSQLKQLINGGYLFKGIVTPSSDVITTDNKIFVVASEVGTYTNFGGYVVTKGELAFLYYDTEWHKGSVEVAVEEEEILATDEDGFAIVDNQLQVGMKYDKNGFDIAKIADHAKEMLESRLYNGAFASVNEDGLFVVDENLNIGVKVDSAGVHAPNILEYEIINE